MAARARRRGLKPGHKKSAAWKKAISAGMKRYHASRGSRKRSGRKVSTGTKRRKRRSTSGQRYGAGAPKRRRTGKKTSTGRRRRRAPAWYRNATGKTYTKAQQKKHRRK